MKRKGAALFMAGMILSLAACGTDNSLQEDNGNGDAGSMQIEQTTAGNEDEANGSETDSADLTETAETDSASASSSESSILIAYFSVPEDIDISGIDADAGASVVVKDGEKLGNVQFMAQTI